MVDENVVLEFIEKKIKGKPTISSNLVVSFLKQVINTLNIGPVNTLTPLEINKYDIIKVNIGPCRHYCIVAKVFKEDNCCVVYPITTSENTKFVVPLNSRLFKKEAKISVIPLEVSIEVALNSFIGIYDNKKEIDSIIRFSKLSLNQLILK